MRQLALTFSKFHSDERGEMTVSQIFLGVVIGLCAMFVFGPAIRSMLQMAADNQALIKHSVIALVILFGGTFLTTKTSKSFDESWGFASMWLYAAIGYWTVSAGLPMLFARISADFDKFQF